MFTQKSEDPFLGTLEAEGGSMSHNCCLQPRYLIPGQQGRLLAEGLSKESAARVGRAKI